MREFDREIREIKKQESESVAYMTYAMKIQEEREEAREEGKIEMILRYIKKKKVSIDAALDDLDVPDAKGSQYTNRLQQLLNWQRIAFDIRNQGCSTKNCARQWYCFVSTILTHKIGTLVLVL